MVTNIVMTMTMTTILRALPPLRRCSRSSLGLLALGLFWILWGSTMMVTGAAGTLVGTVWMTSTEVGSLSVRLVK